MKCLWSDIFIQENAFGFVVWKCWTFCPVSINEWISPGYIFVWCLQYYTVRCCYKAVNFLENPHKRLPIAPLLGWSMGCFLWVQTLKCSGFKLSLQWCIPYHVIVLRYNSTCLYGGCVWTYAMCAHDQGLSQLQSWSENPKEIRGDIWNCGWNLYFFFAL